MAKTRKHYRRGRRSKRRGFASWSLGKKIGAILGGTVALVATAGAVILASKLSKIETTKLDPEALNVSEEARERGTGYLNVALFGVDSRDNELEKDTRSDTIMIASLNRETMEVKISSVYRDTLLEQSDGTLNKANAAYSFGGPETAVAMLNKNLDIDGNHACDRQRISRSYRAWRTDAEWNPGYGVCQDSLYRRRRFQAGRTPEGCADEDCREITGRQPCAD